MVCRLARSAPAQRSVAPGRVRSGVVRVSEQERHWVAGSVALIIQLHWWAVVRPLHGLKVRPVSAGRGLVYVGNGEGTRLRVKARSQPRSGRYPVREPQRRHDVLPRNKGAPQVQEGEGSAARATAPDLPEETEVMDCLYCRERAGA